MIKALVYGNVVSQFEFQSHVHFRTNPFGKGIDTVILSSIG